jgi:trigger factor
MATATLQTSSERVEKDRVKLRVEVPEEALRPAVDAVYRRWAREIRIPGFRKGKVPRQLIDARVGAGAVREEAVRDALPDLYRDALRAEDLEAIAPPEIEVVDLEEEGPLVFEATVDVRPAIDLPELSRVSVEAPSDEVTDADVDEQLERLRDRFAELETVGREARRGDFVLIDIKGYRNEQTVDEASSLDFLYEVGSRSGPPKLDDELQGSRPGAILRFHDEVAVTPEGAEPQPMELSFTVLVKEVKAKKLPPLDDDFAKTVGEFSSLEALRDDLRSRLADIKRQIATDELRALVLQRLVDATQLDPPAKLVDAEFDHQLEHFHDDLRQAGLTLETYARETQSTELEVRSEMRKRAARSVKAELILEEVARRFDINVEEEEIGREIALAAARAEQDPGEVAKRLVETGRVSALAADIMRRKALDHVVESADVAGRRSPNESEE